MFFQRMFFTSGDEGAIRGHRGAPRGPGCRAGSDLREGPLLPSGAGGKWGNHRRYVARRSFLFLTEDACFDLAFGCLVKLKWKIRMEDGPFWTLLLMCH